VLDGLEGSLRLIEQSWVQTNKSDNSSYCKNLLKNTWGEEIFLFCFFVSDRVIGVSDIGVGGLKEIGRQSSI